jgi:hypothetical protein
MTETAGFTDWLQALAAVSSAFAAGAALWVAWKGPRSAAVLSEELRVAGQQREDSRKAKLSLFYTLMEERGSLGSRASMSALNRAEAVFMDSDAVRRELRSLNDLAHMPHSPERGPRMNAQFLSVVHAIASDIGFEGSFTDADFARIFASGAP